MRCLRTAKLRLHKGSVLGWKLLLRFIFPIYKKFLYVVVVEFLMEKEMKN